MTSEFHLPSLSIKGFRGIRSLEINNLGRVTLLAGKNSIGKTTILEAIRVFAARGSVQTILNLLNTREEIFVVEDEDGDKVLIPDFSTLFYNFRPDDENGMPSPIQIKTTRHTPSSVSLNLVEAEDESTYEGVVDGGLHLNNIHVLIDQHKRTIPIGPFRYFRGARRLVPTRAKPSRNPEEWPAPIALQSLGPGLPENDKLAELWDNVALTQSEEFMINALNLATGPKLERLAVIGDPDRLFGPFGRGNRGRRVSAKLNSELHPVPLKRLGDGAQRLLGIALALANCQNGILLIDEVENGIHYSILPKLWGMIFQAAQEGNIQVIATTHSWDCISSFAHSTTKTDQIGSLARLEAGENGIYSVQYSGEDLKIAAEQKIEVR
ncbi:MAG: AAA family ATPase [Aestuariivita sp.]|nr:AAA family ATPase [Aestuariivita sp.]MCY4345706.1 AAA family ATPase [Aestuariivita sp.]